MTFPPTPWWVKLVLPFCRTRVSVDSGKELGEWEVKTRYKKFQGKTYIVSIERYLPLPEHFNCRCIVVDPQFEWTCKRCQTVNEFDTYPALCLRCGAFKESL